MKPLALAEMSLTQELESIEISDKAENTLFSIEDLNLYYGNTKVLSDINLNIKANRIFTLIGPSGCGKTSLLYTMARLVGQLSGAVVQGRVCFDGQNLYDQKTDFMQIRRRIGFVFQKPTPFPFSIYRNIELVLKEHGIKDRIEIDHIIESVLTRVGLWQEVNNRLHKPALMLSGGQQQRLCIARALVLKPKVLLMDEPCSALDPISSGVIEDLIVELGHSYSVVLVTHNLAQARRTADDVAFFWTENGTGVLVESGSANQVFTHAKCSLTAAYVSGAKG